MYLFCFVLKHFDICHAKVDICNISFSFRQMLLSIVEISSWVSIGHNRRFPNLGDDE